MCSGPWGNPSKKGSMEWLLLPYLSRKWMLGCHCGAETKASADHHLLQCPGGNQDAKGVCHGEGKTVSFSEILLTELMSLSICFNGLGLSASLHTSGHLSWWIHWSLLLTYHSHVKIFHILLCGFYYFRYFLLLQATQKWFTVLQTWRQLWRLVQGLSLTTCKKPLKKNRYLMLDSWLTVEGAKCFKHKVWCAPETSTTPLQLYMWVWSWSLLWDSLAYTHCGNHMWSVLLGCLTQHTWPCWVLWI